MGVEGNSNEAMLIIDSSRISSAEGSYGVG